MDWKLKFDSEPIEANGKTTDDKYFSAKPLENSWDRIIIAPRDAQINFPTEKYIKTFFLNDILKG